MTAPAPLLSPADGEALLRVATEAIDFALARDLTSAPAPDPMRFSAALQRDGASFVTLKIAGDLRGCVGTIQPRRALVVDVAGNACAAAFTDPRFPRLSADEWPRTDVSLSVLGPMEPLEAASEADLLRLLRPGVDGLLIREGGSRATFLPQVWDSLSDPTEFLAALKRKMGRASDWWSPDVAAYRYVVEKIGAPD